MSLNEKSSSSWKARLLIVCQSESLLMKNPLIIMIMIIILINKNNNSNDNNNVRIVDEFQASKSLTFLFLVRNDFHFIKFSFFLFVFQFFLTFFLFFILFSSVFHLFYFISIHAFLFLLHFQVTRWQTLQKRRK